MVDEDKIGPWRDEVVKRMLATPPQPKMSPKKLKASSGEAAQDVEAET